MGAEVIASRVVRWRNRSQGFKSGPDRSVMAGRWGKNFVNSENPKLKRTPDSSLSMVCHFSDVRAIDPLLPIDSLANSPGVSSGRIRNDTDIWNVE